jgi:hypothetical protein
MWRVLAISVCIASIPGAAHAQAAIAGTVRDEFGSPIPGVTIEAGSSALIERTRTAIADDAGRYRIEDLRPGIYQVRFTRQGWKSYQREGIELTGTSTATVDAELSIGGVTETVTVTGESPAVDIQSVRHEITLTGELIRSIPTVRSYNALVVLVPGVVTNVNDTVTGTSTTSFPMYGGRTNEGRLSLDGMTVGSPPAGNSAASYVVDAGTADEITFTTPGAAGEVETAGLVLNIVPRSGGNTRRGSFFASGTGEKLQGDNLTKTLKDQGVMAATPLTKVYDFSGTFGGAIERDRIWYFVNAHIGGNTKDSASVYYNLNAGDPTQWLYVPDKSRRAYSDRTFENASGRITMQLTPRNKISGLWDAQALCRTCTGATPGLSEPMQASPEAVGVLGRPLHVTQATWSSPVTSRWLLDAGYTGTYFGVGNFERMPNLTRELIRVVEQCANGCAANGDIPGLAYRSQDFSIAHTGSYLWKGTASFITGTNNVKFGYQHTLMTDDRTWFTNDQNLTYRFNNGIPNQLTESISPWMNNARAAWDGLFVQAQHTHDRFTLQGALRFDRAVSWFPEQREGPSRFLPDPIIIPPTRGVDSYKDLSPRVGVVYDVSGKATTAIKAHVGRYLEGAGTMSTYANSNPSLRMPQTTMLFGTAGVTRSWIDGNGNFIPDCDLLNPAAQDLRTSGGDACGVLSNTSFGKNILTNQFAPDVLNGWGVRPSDWTFAVTLQQQVGTRSSLDVTYTRRWYRGFFVIDNRSLQPSDLTSFSIVAPSDPRLPSGGGYVVSGLYDVVPEKSGQVENLVTSSNAHGAWSQHFDGIDVTMNIRVGNDLMIVGGTSTGQTVADNCDAREHLPELATNAIGATSFGPGLVGSVVSPVSPYCHVAYGVLTQVRGLSSYIVPRVGVQLSTTFQSKPGPMLAANYAAPSSEAARSLGRPLSGNAPNVTVNLVRPGTMYGNRINQLDWRVGKELKHRRARTLLALDIYNALNSSAVLTYDSTFVPGGPWLRPTSILTPRFLKFTAELAF